MTSSKSEIKPDEYTEVTLAYGTNDSEIEQRIKALVHDLTKEGMGCDNSIIYARGILGVENELGEISDEAPHKGLLINNLILMEQKHPKKSLEVLLIFQKHVRSLASEMQFKHKKKNH
jgi:hypothetical protein